MTDTKHDDGGLCPICGGERTSISARLGCPCWRCLGNIQSELMQLGIPVRTARAMSRSGLLNSGWRSFVDVHKDAWYGVNGIGRTGVGHIELARSSFLGRNEPSIAPPLPPAMTLLDYFAGQVLAGMLASGWLLRHFQNNAVPGQSHGQAIEVASITATMDAYDIAAAMIAEKRRREAAPNAAPEQTEG